MAFSTTRREDYVKKGLLKDIITLADTAGNSQAMDLGDAIHITVQVEGTFGGGTVKLQVSNDGVTFYDTPTGTSRNAAGVMAVVELDRGFSKYRLNLSGGDATTNLTCTVVSRIRQAGTP